LILPINSGFALADPLGEGLEERENLFLGKIEELADQCVVGCQVLEFVIIAVAVVAHDCKNEDFPDGNDVELGLDLKVTAHVQRYV